MTGFVWPEPNSCVAGSQMVQLIELFQQQNYVETGLWIPPIYFQLG
jgi:hypothetical protein